MLVNFRPIECRKSLCEEIKLESLSELAITRNRFEIQLFHKITRLTKLHSHKYRLQKNQRFSPTCRHASETGQNERHYCREQNANRKSHAFSRAIRVVFLLLSRHDNRGGRRRRRVCFWPRRPGSHVR